MNGRIYDPTIGRFMSADPFIQAPYELQSHNRYAYVMNNPLLYTDPSGFNWFKKLVIAVVVIVATVYTMGAVAAYMGFAGTMSAAITAAGATFWGSIAMGAAGGFVGGFLSTALNGGSFSQSLKAGLIGGITGAAMGYVGFTYTGNTFGNYIGHAVVSCASSVASGGGSQSCGRAAAASLVGTYVSANTTNANGWNEYSRGAATIVTGGVTSRMMGGTFADGATSAAYGYLFNAFAHPIPDPNGVIPDGPWEEQNGQKPGTFQGPKQDAGGRDQLRWVPPESQGGPLGLKGTGKVKHQQAHGRGMIKQAIQLHQSKLTQGLSLCNNLTFSALYRYILC
jgi:hypothetical protein